MALLVGCFREYQELADAYSDQAVVMGIFRHLSHIAQHFLMTLLFMEEIEERHLVRFAESAQEAETVVNELKSLRLFVEQGKCVKVNPYVAFQVKRILSQPVVCSLRIKTKPDKRRPNIEKILEHFHISWNKIIEFLIWRTRTPSVSILQLLIRAGLISQESQDFQQTAESFRFLLKPTQHQICQLLRQLLVSYQDRAKTAVILYNLSIGKVGQDYSTKGISHGLIADLYELGLIYKYNSKSKRFYVVPQIIGILTNSPKDNIITERFLVVETNFRVYAYTNSELHIVLLSYFMRLEYRLPNLVIGFLTRESVCKAFRDGLQCAQIITFLSNHSKNHNMPDNVAEQIKLWEMERSRINDQEAVMLDEFVDLSLYKSTLNYAINCGAYIWDNQERRVIILKKERYMPVLQYLQHLDRI